MRFDILWVEDSEFYHQSVANWFGVKTEVLQKERGYRHERLEDGTELSLRYVTRLDSARTALRASAYTSLITDITLRAGRSAPEDGVGNLLLLKEEDLVEGLKTCVVSSTFREAWLARCTDVSASDLDFVDGWTSPRLGSSDIAVFRGRGFAALGIGEPSI